MSPQTDQDVDVSHRRKNQAVNKENVSILSTSRFLQNRRRVHFLLTTIVCSGVSV